MYKAYRLVNMNISLTFSHNKKKKFNLPKAQGQVEMEQRIAALCGQPFIEQALYIESENDDYKLSPVGWAFQLTPGASRISSIFFCERTTSKR